MSAARLNTTRARKCLQSFNFAGLFIEELGWNLPASRKPVVLEYEAVHWRVQEISQLSGFRVFEVIPEDRSTPLPNAKTQDAIWKRVALQSVENILIFVDAARTQSLWLWMKREEKRFLARRHSYLHGQPGDLFLSKVAALVVDLSELDDNGNLSITETANRVRIALDVETVTKAFFRDFEGEHGKLLAQIEGIPDMRERRWYTSVLLNRLMFIWFLQAKGFLDGGNRDYLPERFAASQEQKKGQFYACFLRDLFFEGFAKPEKTRKLVGSVPLGDIPYLNGGLFLPHGVEQRTEGDDLLAAPYTKIRIADAAFADLFALFRCYSWSLDDTPGGDDREINPDVLGYIFEKYINQKEFGAYYTRPEITEYLCEQTIHQLVLDRANAGREAAAALHAQNPKMFPAPRGYATLDDLLFHADGPLCARLLDEVLPRLSLLDPACGSGAFLVAAQRTLLNLYTALLGRCEALGYRPVLEWKEKQERAHKAPVAYWLKKKIVTENLYGVDIMEEATEIAKLRLFLSLVASAQTRQQLEPLPNIEFNIQAGNSLIGLLHVDATAFDKGSGLSKKGTATSGQERIEFEQNTGAGELGMSFTSKTAPKRHEVEGAHLAGIRAAKYAELLDEKNRLIEQYKEAPNVLVAGSKDAETMLSLRRTIEAKKATAREVLDRLLLAEFSRLDIEFQQATWDESKREGGRSERRAMRMSDVRNRSNQIALNPFHWGYEFDEIVVGRGGFDAIITNPPWESFKPQSKEFFEDYSDIVTVNNMTIKSFEEEQSRLLANPSIRKFWLEYLSQFPHVSEWFRRSSDYPNQTAIIGGRKVGTDINLYKLFIERCMNLLSHGGRCGIVVPSGIYSDLGAKQLREMLFFKSAVSAIVALSNEKFLFQDVHHSVRFCLISFCKGGRTTTFKAAFRINPRESIGSEGIGSFLESRDNRIDISLELAMRLSPDSLSIREFKDYSDIKIAERLFKQPLLGSTGSSWEVRFSSEFHMTNDSRLFQGKQNNDLLPLAEGKMIHQFRSSIVDSRYWISEKEGRKALLGKANDIGQILAYQEYRVAYRAIARNTDSRTLISTLLPKNTFAGHSLNVANNLDVQKACCLLAFLNSLVVDFALRQSVASNLTIFFLYQVPIPTLETAHPTFRLLAERAARLIGTTPEYDDLMSGIFGSKATCLSHGVSNALDRQRLRAEMDSLVAQLYGLTEDEFGRILSTFPLMSESMQLQTQQTYSRLLRSETFL